MTAIGYSTTPRVHSLSRDDGVENQARIVSGQRTNSRELTGAHAEVACMGKRRGAGRKQGGSVTRSLGTNLTASPTSYPTPMRQRIVANVGGSVLEMSNNL